MELFCGILKIIHQLWKIIHFFLKVRITINGEILIDGRNIFREFSALLDLRISSRICCSVSLLCWWRYRSISNSRIVIIKQEESEPNILCAASSTMAELENWSYKRIIFIIDSCSKLIIEHNYYLIAYTLLRLCVQRKYRHCVNWESAALHQDKSEQIWILQEALSFLDRMWNLLTFGNQ